MPVYDPYTGQPVGTVDRLKTALNATPQQPVAATKGDLPFSYGQGMGINRAPGNMPPGPAVPQQGGGIPERLSQVMTTGQPPIDAQFETVPPSDSMLGQVALNGETRNRDAFRQMGMKLLQLGTPAQQVQGMKMLSEASRPSPSEQAAIDKARYQNAIEDSPASDAAKDRARTMLELGAGSKEIMETLQFDARGLEAEKKKQEIITKSLRRAGKDSYELGIMETEMDRALNIIESSRSATGLEGYVTHFMPWDTPAYNLGERLTTLKTILGYDELSNMRAESTAGGAIGQVTETETRWLQATQGSLDQFQDPDTLKENIIKAVEGKKLVNEMHLLIDAMDQGDPQAVERYREISTQLGRLGADIHERIKGTEQAYDVPSQPGGEMLESQYRSR